MNVFLIAIGIIGIIAAVLIIIVGLTVMTFGFGGVKDREDLGFIGGGIIVVIVGLALIPLSFKVEIAGQRGYGTDACESFAEQTDYTTRYLTTTNWDNGQCFVLWDGSWVPKDQLWLEVGGGGGR